MPTAIKRHTLATRVTISLNYLSDILQVKEAILHPPFATVIPFQPLLL